MSIQPPRDDESRNSLSDRSVSKEDEKYDVTGINPPGDDDPFSFDVDDRNGSDVLIGGISEMHGCLILVRM